VTWGSGQDERWIIGVSTKDTDQTTPNGTVASATGTGTGPTVAATTTSGNLVLDFMSWLDGGGSSWTVTDDVPDSLQEIEGATLQYEGAGASRETAAGASTTCSWTISGGGGNNWGTFALQINEAVAAPAASPPLRKTQAAGIAPLLRF
jgi:muconolactone delta-isomerase